MTAPIQAIRPTADGVIYFFLRALLSGHNLGYRSWRGRVCNADCIASARNRTWPFLYGLGVVIEWGTFS